MKGCGRNLDLAAPTHGKKNLGKEGFRTAMCEVKWTVVLDTKSEVSLKTKGGKKKKF